MEAQELIDWKVLADVRFSSQYSKDLGAYYLVPKFGSKVSRLEKQEVMLSGFFIPFNEQKQFFILSKFPLSACYFCGAAGPETIVELQLKPESVNRFSMDEVLTFKGQLVLNDNDLDHCNYILKNAEPVKN
jgi:hypothetical protein